MKIPPVKGTRDFYPQEMAVRNWIIDGWKKVSLRNGFEEYDGPIFEYLKMFQLKSGDEIVEQLFSLTDRGGRDLALRPEMTPTLARMVNQRINSLPRPVKWFSVPRLFRAERPQKGRLREFFQWNIDIIGEDSVLADAEVIFTTVDYLRQVGLTDRDIKVKISSRKFLAGFLKGLGIPEQKLGALYVLLDKSSKLPADAFEELLIEQIPEKSISDKILKFMTEQSSEQMIDLIGPNECARTALDEINQVFEYLKNMGVSDYCIFDPGIVRGLAYYTGIVFEVHDVVGELRAICGGGRYDNLLKDFGGPAIPATGMGMGDCVLEILLREKWLLEKQLPEARLEYFVACVDESFKDATVGITMALRSRGFAANFSYKSGKLSKQLKQASDSNAKKCIIIGEEFKDKKLVIKDMVTGRQEEVEEDKFFAGLEKS
ncbi:MAG: histidine--tRNA ligase [Sedimentisphaerales bacterium]|nr:histidine--tRNA ligase [Sedimentisphaerales bacterium]